MSIINKETLKQDILKLKKEKNAVILAHYYQNIEVDEVADYVGDSLYLSQMAAQTEADMIVFCGVFFMAETAKILSPNKKVILPKIQAGCAMADMLSEKALIEFKEKYPGTPIVCYINSTAEVKSHSDICCTSSNAIKVVKSLGSDKILFVPDKGLGGYVNSKIDHVEVISFDGYCPVHMDIKPDEISSIKANYPEAMVLVHPESHKDVINLADFVGSTTGIINTAKESNKKEFIIVTEKGVVDRLQRDCPDKNFFLASPNAVCDDMKLIYLEDILEALKSEKPQIFMEEDMAKKASSCINKMLKVS